MDGEDLTQQHQSSISKGGVELVVESAVTQVNESPKNHSQIIEEQDVEESVYNEGSKRSLIKRDSTKTQNINMEIFQSFHQEVSLLNLNTLILKGQVRQSQSIKEEKVKGEMKVTESWEIANKETAHQFVEELFKAGAFQTSETVIFNKRPEEEEKIRESLELTLKQQAHNYVDSIYSNILTKTTETIIFDKKAEPKITESWDRANKVTAHSFINELFLANVYQKSESDISRAATIKNPPRSDTKKFEHDSLVEIGVTETNHRNISSNFGQDDKIPNNTTSEFRADDTEIIDRHQSAIVEEKQDRQVEIIFHQSDTERPLPKVFKDFQEQLSSRNKVEIQEEGLEESQEIKSHQDLMENSQSDCGSNFRPHRFQTQLFINIIEDSQASQKVSLQKNDSSQLSQNENLESQAQQEESQQNQSKADLISENMDEPQVHNDQSVNIEQQQEEVLKQEEQVEQNEEVHQEQQYESLENQNQNLHEEVLDQEPETAMQNEDVQEQQQPDQVEEIGEPFKEQSLENQQDQQHLYQVNHEISLEQEPRQEQSSHHSDHNLGNEDEVKSIRAQSEHQSLQQEGQPNENQEVELSSVHNESQKQINEELESQQKSHKTSLKQQSVHKSLTLSQKSIKSQRQMTIQNEHLLSQQSVKSLQVSQKSISKPSQHQLSEHNSLKSVQSQKLSEKTHSQQNIQPSHHSEKDQENYDYEQNELNLENQSQTEQQNQTVSQQDQAEIEQNEEKVSLHETEHQNSLHKSQESLHQQNDHQTESEQQQQEASESNEQQEQQEEQRYESERYESAQYEQDQEHQESEEIRPMEHLINIIQPEIQYTEQLLAPEDTQQICMASSARFSQSQYPESPSFRKEQSEPSEQEEQFNEDIANGIADEAVEKALNLIFREELRVKASETELQVEELVAQVTEHQCEQTIIHEIYKEAIEDSKQDMYEKFIEKLCLNALDTVINRIVHEFLCLFEVATLDKVADNAVSNLESRIMESIIGEFIDYCDSGAILAQGSAVQNAQNLTTQQINYITQNQPQKLKVIKKKNLRKVGEDGQEIKPKTKKLKEKRINKLGLSSEFNLSGLLDIHFFEKCFFGKRLQLKDQVIFQIYAKELLELIKTNLSRDIKRKLKIYTKQKKLMMEQNIRSRSPQSAAYSRSHDLRGYFQFLNQKHRQSTPPHKIQVMSPGGSFAQKAKTQEDGQCLNIMIKKASEKQENVPQQTIIQQAPQPQVQKKDTQLSNNLQIPSENQINSFIDYNDFPNFSQSSQRQPMLTQNQTNNFTNDMSSLPSAQNASMEQTKILQPQSQMVTAKLQARKKRQPTQVKELITEENKFTMNSFNGESRSKTLKVTSSPMKQQIKVFQNLESNMKEILMKNSLSNNMRLKRRIQNYTQTEKVSPVLSPLGSNGELSVIPQGQRVQNFVFPAGASISNQPVTMFDRKSKDSSQDQNSQKSIKYHQSSMPNSTQFTADYNSALINQNYQRPHTSSKSRIVRKIRAINPNATLIHNPNDVQIQNFTSQPLSNFGYSSNGSSTRVGTSLKIRKRQRTPQNRLNNTIFEKTSSGNQMSLVGMEPTRQRPQTKMKQRKQIYVDNYTMDVHQMREFFGADYSTLSKYQYLLKNFNKSPSKSKRRRIKTAFDSNQQWTQSAQQYSQTPTTQQMRPQIQIQDQHASNLEQN